MKVEDEGNDYVDDSIEYLEEDEIMQKSSINAAKDYKIKEFTDSCEFGELACSYPDKSGDYRMVIGNSWQLYVIITLIYLAINIFFYYKYWKYLGSMILRIGLGLYITSLLTGIRVFFSNPGVPNLKTNEELKKLPDTDRGFCEKCNVWINYNQIVIHCPECNCCIDDYTQHSAFFCKCIGKGNYISYNIFVVTNLLSMAFIVLIKGLTH